MHASDVFRASLRYSMTVPALPVKSLAQHLKTSFTHALAGVVWDSKVCVQAEGGHFEHTLYINLSRYIE